MCFIFVLGISVEVFGPNLLVDRNIISTKLLSNSAEDLNILLLSYNKKNFVFFLTDILFSNKYFQEREDIFDKI
jgi:hypothetical protein